MQCPSCGANNIDSGSCIECDQPENLTSPNDATDSQFVIQPEVKKSSTLIEFPGVNRTSVPEWRKELTVRVREVQERRAREAAREAAEAERRRAEAAAHPPQLELLPQTEAPPINPLVAAALRRIERAHQIAPKEPMRRATVATAVAYAPTLEVQDPLPEINDSSPKTETQPTFTAPEQQPLVETLPKLVAVPKNQTSDTKLEKPPVPKRLIVDDPNDPALNYLDSIDRTLRVDEISNQRASAFRRVICSVFDLVTCALLASPILLALYSKGVDLTAPRPLTVVIGSAVLLTFLYFTLSIALTGRTWAMKLFSLRVIDRRTGLIPTGSQSASRAFFYLVSLAIAGLGVLYALVSREGDAMHDRFTRTAVIKI
jgi:RDD family